MNFLDVLSWVAVIDVRHQRMIRRYQNRRAKKPKASRRQPHGGRLNDLPGYLDDHHDMLDSVTIK